ncbi:MAG: EAL domain-containing protein [Actinomycetota bacterium]
MAIRANKRITAGSAGASRIRRGIGVRGLMAITAIVPLIGLVAATWISVDDANSVGDEAARLERQARHVQSYTLLDGSLFDEFTLTLIDELGGNFGIEPAMIDMLMGTSLQDDLARVRAATDAALAQVDESALTDVIGDIRSDDMSFDDAERLFGELRTDVRVDLSAAIDDLQRLTTVTSPELVESIELLSSGIGLRAAIAESYFAYFSVMFDVRGDGVSEIRSLVGARADIDSALGILEQSASGRDVAEDPALVAFVASIDRLIDDSLERGVEEQRLGLDLASIVPRIPEIQGAAFVATGEASTNEQINDHADDVVAAAAAIRIDAEAGERRAVLLASALVGLTIVTVLLAARLIVQPLRRLNTEVDRLSTGEAPDQLDRVVGPHEVKAATEAIQRASMHFALATDQARSLATGDLDADVLDRRAEGGLGESLQVAVGRLRQALADQQEFQRRLSHESTHDGLTQLPNRNAAMAQLTRALARTKRSGAQLAVLLLDLNNFKTVNDHHGHHCGDLVLTTIAQRIVNHVREGDFVGRLGGDEFVVIAEPVQGVEDAMELAERLVDVLDDPVAVGDESIELGASVGVALAESAQLTADELLRDADLAVYRAKDVGSSGIEICDEDLRTQFLEATDFATAIRRAIAEDEFIMHYQPIVDTDGYRPRSMEALVRWLRSDTGEMVSPGEFIEFAERSDLIVDLDCWVIDAVVAQLAAWQHDERFAGLPVAVNLSGRHLQHPDVERHVLEPLERHGVDPRLLVIELTESALVNDLAAASTRLRHMREMGVRIAIDDFGTGYTSLAHLRALPVDILKIDRSFVVNAAVDPSEASIVKLIIDAGHLLGATVTAEGIEEPTEAHCLRDLGSDSLQGFFFARPQSAAALEAAAHLVEQPLAVSTDQV